MAKSTSGAGSRSWPDYAAVRRWHFYAGLFCLPFFCWLAITGSIYLFKPDFEDWLDHPYESLAVDGLRTAPSSEARAALAAVPGSTFSRYEPPATSTGAAQILVAQDGHLFRVYVHPASLQALKIERDDHRLMELIAHLHGELLLGSGGSMLVELAGSWGIVMIVTGFYLWLPRSNWRLAGVLYPRLRQGSRVFWRDLHAVTGLWVSTVTLFLLLSGLPWAANWGNYLTWARNHWTVTAGTPDWPIGGQMPPASTTAPSNIMPGMSAAEMTAISPSVSAIHNEAAVDLDTLDKLAPLAAQLHVPRPIWISPPAQGIRDWTISSHIQNRPLRVTYSVAPDSALVTATQTYANQNIVDKIVNVVIATHEGQLFGRINQAILLVTAVGLLLMSTSAVVMWWRRRPAGLLGAPVPAARPNFSVALAVVVALLGVLLPLFAASAILVALVERLFLRRMPPVRHWLGLNAAT